MRINRFILICSILLGLSLSFSMVFASSDLFNQNHIYQLTPTAFNYLPSVFALPSPTPACVPFPFIPPDNQSKEQSTISGLNSQRVSNGLPSLVVQSELTQSSRRHSEDMANNNFTSHTGSDGSNTGQRMTEACYEWSSWGEIIGWGFGGNTTQMINWWMNSPPHKAIILSASFVDFGAGYSKNTGSNWGHYWTVNFGIREDEGKITTGQEVYTCSSAFQIEEGGSMITITSTTPCVDIFESE